MPWRHCIFTDAGVVFPPCPPLKTQPSRSFGSGSGPHLTNKPSRDLREALERMLLDATASAATISISPTRRTASQPGYCCNAAPESPATSLGTRDADSFLWLRDSVPWEDERAALAAKVAPTLLQAVAAKVAPTLLQAADHLLHPPQRALAEDAAA